MIVRKIPWRLSLALLAAGCASVQQYAPISGLPSGSRVNLVIEIPEIESPDAESGSESIGKKTATGAGIGAAAGATGGVEASFACGPFVVFCAPAFGLIGAAGGTIVGAVGGAVVGAALALPAEKAMEVESIIDTTLAENDLATLFEDEFRRHNAGRWMVVSEGSATTVTIGIDGLYLQQSTGDKLAVELQSFMYIQYGSSQADKTKKILFRSSSDEYDVDYWIADNGNALRREIVNGFSEVTRQMNAAMVK